MAFRVGQQVECIKAFCGGILPDNNKGDTYTIARIEQSDKVGEIGLIFDGTPLIPWPGGPHLLCSYSPERFRPLQETSMSILYGLLKTKSEKELVE